MKVISISGPDGSGKSTLLNEIKQHYFKKNVKVTIKRSRPIGFPIVSTLKYGKKAEQRAASENHKHKSPKNPFLSIIVFSYYYIDYLVGTFFLNAQKIFKSDGVIIFDRYYFDYVCNIERFSLNVNTDLISFLYIFIYKPDKNIFLECSADDILMKRDELTKTQINQINFKFNELFSKFSGKNNQYKVISGLKKDTLNNAINFLEDK